MGKVIKNVILLVVFAVCVGLVIIGQRNISLTGLAMELIGLVGLLVLLFLYNRTYKCQVCWSIYADINKGQISILRIPALSFMFSRSGKKSRWQRGGIGTSWYQILSVGESFRSVL